MNNQQTNLILELIEEKLAQDLDKTTRLILEGAKEELTDKEEKPEQPIICEICSDVFYKSYERDKEHISSIEETGMCNNCAYKNLK